MTYIAFFLQVCRSLLCFFNSCSPSLLSVGDSLISLGSSFDLSPWGWIRCTSVSLFWLRRCRSCLSGWFFFPPLTQRCCSGSFSPVSPSLPTVRPHPSENLSPSLKCTRCLWFCGKSLYLLCLISFVLPFSVLTKFSLRVQSLSPCVCVCVCLFDNGAIFFFHRPCCFFHFFSLLSCVCKYKFPFFFLAFFFFFTFIDW